MWPTQPQSDLIAPRILIRIASAMMNNLDQVVGKPERPEADAPAWADFAPARISDRKRSASPAASADPCLKPRTIAPSNAAAFLATKASGNVTPKATPYDPT